MTMCVFSSYNLYTYVDDIGVETISQIMAVPCPNTLNCREINQLAIQQEGVTISVTESTQPGRVDVGKC